MFSHQAVSMLLNTCLDPGQGAKPRRAIPEACIYTLDNGITIVLRAICLVVSRYWAYRGRKLFLEVPLIYMIHQRIRFVETYFVLVLIAVSLMLLWNGQLRKNDFKRSEIEMMRSMTHATAIGIGSLLADRKNQIKVFVEDFDNQLTTIANNPDDDDLFDALNERLIARFPNVFAFTVAGVGGEPLIEDIEGLVGDICKVDIKKFARSNSKNSSFSFNNIYIHPQPFHYHYDIMMPWQFGSVQSVFFVSFEADSLAKVLKRDQVPGYSLYILRTDETSLIEVSANGVRDVLERDIHLSKQEQDSIGYRFKIAGTLWEVVAIADPIVFATFINTMYLESFTVFAVVGLVGLILVIIYRQTDARRIKAEHELSTANEVLEHRVIERTEALQKSEAGFREVLDNSRDVLYKFNLKTGLYEYVSPAISQLLGVSAQEYIQGGIELVLSLLHPEDKTLVHEHFDILLNYSKNKDIQKTLEYRMNNPVTGYRWLSDNRVIVYDSNRVAESVIGNIRDITESKLQEQLLHRSQKMDALGKLTGGISHDFNNLLGIIKGYAELLDEAITEQPELEKFIKNIRLASERGAKLTRKLLSFSKQQQSDERIQNINSLLIDEKLMLEKTLTARISLVFELQEDLWPVLLEVSDLEDAILNISINAMHAIEESGMLTIKTRNVNIEQLEAIKLGLQAGDYVLLSFTDTGCGMDTATKMKVYDPFFTTKGGKGTGLGLAQVHGFIERSGGKIQVISELGQGAKFIFYFPRYIGSSERIDINEEADVSDLSGSESILVVDDEPALLEFYYNIFKQHGYNVTCADSGEVALERLKSESFDLLFTDFIMPNMDGFQLAKEALKINPNIKIQLISGYISDNRLQLLDEDLKKNILTKPVSTQNILKSIFKLLN